MLADGGGGPSDHLPFRVDVIDVCSLKAREVIVNYTNSLTRFNFFMFSDMMTHVPLYGVRVYARERGTTITVVCNL